MEAEPPETPGFLGEVVEINLPPPPARGGLGWSVAHVDDGTQGVVQFLYDGGPVCGGLRAFVRAIAPGRTLIGASRLCTTPGASCRAWVVSFHVT